MKSSLKSEHYISDRVFEQEKTSIFRRIWIFACFKNAVDADQAYAVREIAGVSIFIKNDGGEIGAFENLCPHRQMPIFSLEFGQAKTVCPYHGWVFDRGHVKTIPKENELYSYTSLERQELCLKSVAIHIVGGLVFINLSKKPDPIESQFSFDFLEKIKVISENFSSVASHANIVAKYNWKLNFENVLDWNHVPYIHPKTFSPIIVKNKAQSTLKHQFPQVDESIQAQSFHTAVKIKLDRLSWHEMVNRHGEVDVYQNFFIFPNVNFISIGGVVFLLQQFHPVSANRTQVRFTLCTANEKQKINALPAILRGQMRQEISVLQEDLCHLERLQLGLHAGAKSAQHGAYESRLQSFAAAYLNLLCFE